MQGVTGIVLVLTVGGILLWGAVRRQDAYGAFLQGAERGMHSAVSLLPVMVGMMLMIGLMNASGLMALATRLAAPLLRLLGIPEEVMPMILLRPLTGSGSIAALEAIFRSAGVDSRAGRMASVLMGSSETIFYTMTIYAGAAGVRKLPGAMAASLIGYGAGVLLCSVIIR